MGWIGDAITWIGRLVAGLAAFMFGWKSKESADDKALFKAIQDRQAVDAAVDAMSDSNVDKQLRDDWTQDD